MKKPRNCEAVDRATKPWPFVLWRGLADAGPLKRQRLQLLELLQRQRFEILVELQ
ncbi:hypothetical protein D3C77_687490 [compost metagenome]